MVTDENGQESARLVQTPYGVLNIQASSGTDDFRPKFGGKERDEQSTNGALSAPATDLSYFGARYYAPAFGRFISPDPLLGSTNPYHYVLDNPVSLTDPTGMLQKPSSDENDEDEEQEMNDSRSTEFSDNDSLDSSTDDFLKEIPKTDAGLPGSELALGAADWALLAVAAVATAIDIFKTLDRGGPAGIPAAPSPNPGTGFTAPIIPGSWANAGSSRVTQALNVSAAPYAAPSETVPDLRNSLSEASFLPAGSFAATNIQDLGLQSDLDVCPPTVGSSFAAGTQVKTPDGQKAIEALHVGDLVLAFTEEGQPTKAKVTSLFSRTAPQTLVLKLADGTDLTVTPQHPFLTAKGWKAAADLRPGEELVRLQGGTMALRASTQSSAARVFDIEVTPHHTYAVTKSGLVAHNIFNSCWRSFVAGVRRFEPINARIMMRLPYLIQPSTKDLVKSSTSGLDAIKTSIKYANFRLRGGVGSYSLISLYGLLSLYGYYNFYQSYPEKLEKFNRFFNKASSE
ncbi:MAG TPA: RHS repeat-associated core domain-containing protein [Dongiaceae bacterium]|nr:RHS repeat-associated core domain-containing protein [Dongiaceae bacterium]